MNSKMKENWISLFLLVFAVVCIFAYYFTSDNVYNPNLGGENVIVEAQRVQTIDESRENYYLQLEDIGITNNTLLFYSNHQEIFVYADDVLVYSLKKADSVFGRTPGAVWNMVNLPIGTEEVLVTAVQVYPNISKQVLEFELGSGIHMYREVLEGSSVELILSATIIIIGIALFLYWMLVFRKINTQREVLYLGLFAIIFGIWNFGETQYAVFMFENRAFFSYLAFTCLMVMCLPAVFFFKEFLEVEDKVFYKLVAGYIVIETLVCQFLHLTGIASVKETGHFAVVSIALILSYLLYAIIKGLLTKRNTRKIIINIIGLVLLAVTAVVDITSYYVNVLTAVKIAKFGFLAYAILLGIETTRIARVRLQEEQKLELLKEMAVKDMLTGCFNRNAYAEDISNIEDLTGVQIIGFDLNDLKKCNDTKGHKAGDQYIIDSAHMITKLFGEFGKIYRIGGDEFCIITKGVTEVQFENKKALLKMSIAHYLIDHPDSGFGISFGYATYDPEVDEDIEAVRHRADVSMYEYKKEIKKLT